MEPLYNSPRLKSLRRKLRRRQTYPEKVLWSQLRNRRLEGYKFFRQYSVGPYILDFYCASERLAIELDGPQHYVGNAPAYDAARTDYLNRCGIRVIRFRNGELLSNPNNVIAAIIAALSMPGSYT